MKSTTLDKHFDHLDAQPRWNRAWEARGVFPPDDASGKAPFVIVLPPPNVTGVLHIGHVLGDTVMDLLIRWNRMRGYNTLWLPGTDHAGIATQKVVENQLQKEGLSRHEMSREEFLEHAWRWKETHHERIKEQLHQLGCAFDWTREAFTLDEPRSRAVREVFVRLYDKGLIYRGDYIVNWCPTCRTAISDEEVEYVEKNGHLWWIRYPGDKGDVVVATTRPETMLGDTGVAVSPTDPAKAALVGTTVTLPLLGRILPVVADDVVDAEFGSGFVKVTPAHDPNDFGIGQRHGLPHVVVIGRDGRMTDAAGEAYAGLDRFAARKRVVADLEAQGLLVKTEDYRHSVGQHDRCSTVIEPLLSRQWFVKMEPLARPAIEVVERSEVTFYPERWRNVYMSWMTSIRDWCISRQLWWGHRIPVWYCGDCDHITVSRSDPTACGGCNGARLTQDEDVLDTWFSSWLWTFSPMGWPDSTADLKRYHPTSVLVTAPEIIFFWVARMIMASLEFVGEIPFRHVFLTGIVRDGQGRKMSKSLGNSPDPLDIIEKWGTDPFRFTLTMLSPPGNDIFFDEAKLDLGRNFLNKVWQASRMVTGAAAEIDASAFSGNVAAEDPFSVRWKATYSTRLGFVPELEWEDRWILSALERAATDLNAAWSQWRLNDGASRVYDFFWHDYCDWYLELSKVRLHGDGDKRTVCAVLLHVLGESLKMLHPMMPYVTEEIWDKLPMTDGLLLENAFPDPDGALADGALDARMILFRDIVTAARNIRAQYRVPPSREIPLRVKTPVDGVDAVEAMRDGIVRLAKIGTLEVGPDAEKEKGSAVTPVGAYEIIVPLAGVVDLDAEYARLSSEKGKIEKEIEQVMRKLDNADFVGKARPEVVQRERDRRELLNTERNAVVESMRIIHPDGE